MPTLIDPSTVFSALYGEAPYTGTGGGNGASFGSLASFLSSVDPDQGSPVDGRAPASFNGTSYALKNSNNTATCFASGTHNEISGYALFLTRTAPTSLGGGYNDGNLLYDQGAAFGMGHTSSGFSVGFQIDGNAGGHATARGYGYASAPTNQWVYAQFYTALGMLYIRVSTGGASGSWAPFDVNTATGLFGTGGSSYCDDAASGILEAGDPTLAGQSNYDGNLLSIGGTSIATSQATFDGIGYWLQARYPSINIGFPAATFMAGGASFGPNPTGFKSSGPRRHFVPSPKNQSFLVTSQPRVSRGFRDYADPRPMPVTMGPMRSFKSALQEPTKLNAQPFLARGAIPTGIPVRTVATFGPFDGVRDSMSTFAYVPSGPPIVNGIEATTLDDAATTAAGVVLIQGAASAASDDVSGAATAAALVKGAAAAALADATETAAGIAKAQGAESTTLAGATESATGTAPAKATETTTLADVTGTSSGGSGAAHGDESSTLANATGSAAGVALVKGAESSTLADATTSSAGLAPAKGTESTTLGAATEAAAGVAKAQAVESTTLAGATTSAAGVAKVQGAEATTLADTAGTSAGGAATAHADESSTLADVTSAASGIAATKATESTTLAGATETSSGTARAGGTESTTLSNVAETATGKANAQASEDSALADAATATTGTARAQGGAAVALDGASIDGIGAVRVRGAAFTILDNVGIDSDGSVDPPRPAYDVVAWTLHASKNEPLDLFAAESLDLEVSPSRSASFVLAPMISVDLALVAEGDP